MYTEQLIIRGVSQDAFSRLVWKSNDEGKREAKMVEKQVTKGETEGIRYRSIIAVFLDY